jgi:acyl-CoA synthetase (AMP-forming)/AMP-acid ligase II
MLVNCSEPVRADSHERFFARVARCGLDARALTACYAMAEATFAVTQTRPGHQAKALHAKRDELAQGRYEPASSADLSRTCVSSGHDIPGCEVRISGANGEQLADGLIGEIEIRSSSLFDGYRNDSEGTARVLRGGWYASGDYGFRHARELYVIGRNKDIIIVAGKNLFPEDIEDAVGQVDGVIPGRVVAFGEDDDELGTEGVSVIVETSLHGSGDLGPLRVAVLKAAMAIDVTLRRVYIAPLRWLIKSSAGKPSRRANKDRASELLPRTGHQ